MMNTQQKTVTGEGNAPRRLHKEIRNIGNLWAIYEITEDGHFWGDREVGNRRFLLFSQAESFLKTILGD